MKRSLGNLTLEIPINWGSLVLSHSTWTDCELLVSELWWEKKKTCPGTQEVYCILNWKIFALKWQCVLWQLIAFRHKSLNSTVSGNMQFPGSRSPRASPWAHSPLSEHGKQHAVTGGVSFHPRILSAWNRTNQVYFISRVKLISTPGLKWVLQERRLKVTAECEGFSRPCPPCLSDLDQISLSPFYMKRGQVDPYPVFFGSICED